MVRPRTHRPHFYMSEMKVRGLSWIGLPGNRFWDGKLHVEGLLKNALRRYTWKGGKKEWRYEWRKEGRKDWWRWDIDPLCNCYWSLSWSCKDLWSTVLTVTRYGGPRASLSSSRRWLVMAPDGVCVWRGRGGDNIRSTDPQPSVPQEHWYLVSPCPFWSDNNLGCAFREDWLDFHWLQDFSGESSTPDLQATL